MDTVLYPRFLDVEASSLSRKSYPIEIAWSDRFGNIESYLINVHAVDSWLDWSYESYEIHGISREMCKKDGVEPNWLCNRLDESISSDEIIYCDGGELDEFWVDELFGAGSKRGYADFKIRHSDILMLEMLKKCPTGNKPKLALLRELKSEARKRVNGQHRAYVDVQYLIELYKLCVYF